MAKPRSPKKSNGGKDPASSAITQPAASELSAGTESATAAASPLEAAKAETRNDEPKKAKAPKKPEIVKAEPRANRAPINLVPINLEDEIRRLAYLLSERRGFEAGHEAEDWINAEREIRQRYHQQSA